MLLRHKDYHEFMLNNYEHEWTEQASSDMDKLYQVALDCWNDLMNEGQEEAEGNLVALAMITQMEPRELLLYRTALAEEGQEYTPLQVKMLAASISYAFTLYYGEPEEGDDDYE